MPDGLEIAAIDVGGGARLGLCRLPGLCGDLQRDIDSIVAWRASIVVSLTERAEMEAAGCGDLHGALGARNIAWTHFPISDFGVPGAAMRPAWLRLSAELHARLDAGDGILFHCRGGRGRSGMIALRLLVERGEAAAFALARLRAVRPGAVETDEQMAWAKAGIAHRHDRPGFMARSENPGPP